MKTRHLLIFPAVAALLIACSTAQAESLTAEQLQTTLRDPLALFVIMLVAWGANGWKQTTQAKRQGTSDMTFFEYFSFAKETIGAFLANVLAFVFLLATGQFNANAPLGLMITAVIGIGYGTNSIMDLTSKTGRSAALAGQVPEAGK